jgi:hypothetical protein
MALRALHFEPDVDRASPPDLHHIAQPVDRRGFANEAQVGLVALLAHEID